MPDSLVGSFELCIVHNFGGTNLRIVQALGKLHSFLPSPSSNNLYSGVPEEEGGRKLAEPSLRMTVSPGRGQQLLPPTVTLMPFLLRKQVC